MPINAPYKVLTVPDRFLKEKAEDIACINDKILTILDNILLTMRAYNGIGLAATQVGLKQRMVVMEIPDQLFIDNNTDSNIPSNTSIYKMINPKIIFQSENQSSYEESCLSVPGQRALITRPAEIKLQYLNEQEEQLEIMAQGILATCIQHEIDHLDGILYIDYLSPLKRNLLIKNSIKFQKKEINK